MTWSAAQPPSALLDLGGKTALVTGAGAGIGRSIALALSAAGARVVAADRDAQLARETAEHIAGHGGEALPVAADVADKLEAERVVELALERFQRIDILVNNAGIYPPAGVLPDIDLAVFQRTLQVNLEGALNYLCAAGRHMEAGACIVNVSSNVSLRPAGPGIAHYSASKAAVNALTRSAAVDLGPRGIRVNAVLPGIVATEGTRAMAGKYDSFAERTPSGRIGRPEDISQVVLFLASPLSEFVNGQCLAVDGGASSVG